MGMPIEQDAIQSSLGQLIYTPPPQTRLDKILNYLSNAPAEVQIVAIIGFVIVIVLFLRSDMSDFITKRLKKG